MHLRFVTRLANLMPIAAQDRALRAQLPSLPFLMAQPPTLDGPSNVLDSRPLYAGANVGRISDIRPAAELVKVLTPWEPHRNRRRPITGSTDTDLVSIAVYIEYR